MTDAAMDGEVHLQSVYDHRLQLLNPTRAEIRELEYQYRQNLVPDVQAVIQSLVFAGKELFIISGGLLAAVRPFGEWLSIPAENIRAVEVNFNSLSGTWWDYQQDRWGTRPDVTYLDSAETPLVESQGKADVARDLLQSRKGRSLLIGDGMSDLAARPAVDLVVGFGGVIVRPTVEQHADLYIYSESLTPVVALAISYDDRAKMIQSRHRAVLEKGLALINTGQVKFNA
jgi:phosphoserine phosphatase